MKRTLQRLLTVACCASLPGLAACTQVTPDQISDMFTPSSTASAGTQEGTTATLYLTIVEGLIDQGRNRAALGYLDQYAVSETKTPRYYMLRGEAALGVDEYDEAAKAFSALDGTDLAAAGANGLGRVAAAKKDWVEAGQKFADAVAKRPSSADYLNNLGFAELHLGGSDLAKAEDDLRQAQELDPASASIRNNLVLALMMNGKEADARALLDSIQTPRERAQVQKFAADWVESQHKSTTTE